MANAQTAPSGARRKAQAVSLAHESKGKADMKPEQAARLVRRLRRVSFFINAGIALKAENGSIDVKTPIPITAQQAIGLLGEMGAKAHAEVRKGRAPALIHVVRSGDELFLG